MKIIIAVHHFPPKYAAGAELRAYRTAKWLQKEGHDVRVVCIEKIDYGPDNGVYWKEDQYNGIPVRRLYFDLSKAENIFRWEYDNPWVQNHLENYFLQFRPDIFHLISGYLMGAGAIKAAYSSRIPTIITLTDFWFFCPRINLLRPDGNLSDPFQFDVAACVRCKYEEKRRYRLPAQVFPKIANLVWSLLLKDGLKDSFGVKTQGNEFIRRYSTLKEMLSKASAIICPTRYLVETLIARAIPTEIIHLNSHGLDKSSWDPVEDTPENDVFRVGYLGQINNHKGIHILIRAFSQLPHSRSLELLIYGDEEAAPKYTSRLKRLIDHDTRIKIMGKYEYKDIAKIFSRLDIIVIPSLWNEIGPWVMYEALETKTPVIASNIPNMSYVIQHDENGLLFRRADADDLAAQLQRVISDKNLYSRLLSNIKPVKTIEQEMCELNRIYTQVISNK